MKITIVAAVYLVLSCTVVHSDLTLQVQALTGVDTTAAPGQVLPPALPPIEKNPTATHATATVYLSGKMMRVETKYQGPTVVDIVNTETGADLYLDTGLKQYVVKNNHPNNDFVIGTRTVSDMGKGEFVLGHQCEHYVVDTNTAFNIGEKHFVIEYRWDLQTALDLGATTPVPWLLGLGSIDYASLMKVPGVPLIARQTLVGAGDTDIWKVTSISTAPVDTSEFEMAPPSDYKPVYTGPH